jgi:hypothetical protein
MKRVLAFLLLAFSLTGCAVRTGYYRDPYWRDHDGYRYHDRDDRWHDRGDRR